MLSVRIGVLPRLVTGVLIGAICLGDASKVCGQSVSGTIRAEDARRTRILHASIQAIEDGDKLFNAGEYEAALDRYRFVIQNLPDSARSQEVFQAATVGIVDTTMRLATEAEKGRRWEVAAEAAEEGLKYDSDNKTLRPILERANRRLGRHEVIPEYAKSPVITERFEDAVRQVELLLEEGDRLIETGQFEKAEDRYNKVLVIDPFNERAVDKLKEVAKRIRHYAKDAHAHSRDEMLYQVTKAWFVPPKPSLLNPEVNQSAAPASFTRIAEMEEKLDTIVIDRIDFAETAITDAVGILRTKTKQLDPEGRGINFVLKTTTATITGAEPAEEAAEADPFAAGLGGGTGPQLMIESIENKTVSLTVENLSVARVLDLIAEQADLIYRVDENAVIIVSATENIETLFTREFRVPAGFIPLTTPAEGAAAAAAATEQRERVRQRLEELGVEFPTGATASFIPSGSKLIVRNTLRNLELIDRAIREESAITPQVQIETRFMEVNQDSIDELAFRFNVNQRRSGQSRPTDTPGLRTSAPLPAIVGGALPRDLAVAGDAITRNGLDALLFNLSSFGGPLGTAVQSAITLTKYKFEMLVYALSQKTGTDLLAVPSITTKSGQEATVRISRQFFYPDPDNINPPEIDANVTTLPSGNTFRLVTPSTPSDFLDRDIGVILSVIPQVFPDNQTIGLTLRPQIVDFEGFINYGSPINSVDLNTGEARQVAQNFINTPVFNIREVETSLTLADQQTVLIGGLIREDVQKVDDKVPFFGELPVIGRLFRSKIDQSIKKNLLIFVTTTLIGPDGELFNKAQRFDDQSFANDRIFTRVERYEPGAEVFVEDMKGSK